MAQTGGVFTKLSTTVKSAALEAAKAAKPRWHLIDAKGQIVGRLANQIAPLLRGQHKPFFCPNWDCGDYVVVINARHVRFMGRKMSDKKYYWHTMYPGGLRSITPKELMHKDKSEEILRHAVIGMLPKNSLRHKLIKKLRVFPDEFHLYEKQLEGKQSLI